MTVVQILNIIAIVNDALDNAISGDIQKEQIGGVLDILQMLQERLELQTGGVSHV